MKDWNATAEELKKERKIKEKERNKNIDERKKNEHGN